MTNRIAPPDTLPEYDDLKLTSFDLNPVDVAALQSAVHEVAEKIVIVPNQEIDPTDVHVESRELSLSPVQRWSEAA